MLGLNADDAPRGVLHQLLRGRVGQHRHAVGGGDEALQRVHVPKPRAHGAVPAGDESPPTMVFTFAPKPEALPSIQCMPSRACDVRGSSHELGGRSFHDRPCMVSSKELLDGVFNPRRFWRSGSTAL